MGISIGLGVMLGNRTAGASGPRASIVGLTSNPTYGATAEIGTHGSITAAISDGTITATKWGSSAGGTQYGTGASPTDFAADDGGTLHLTVTVGGVDYAASATIRQAPPTVTGTLADKEFTFGVAIPTIDATAAFTGSGVTYTATGLPIGITCNTGGSITGTSTDVDDIEVNPITVFATSTGGEVSTTFDMDMRSGAVTVDAGTNTASVDIGADTGTITVNIGGTDYTFTAADLDTFAAVAPVDPTISRTTGASDVVGSTYTAVRPYVLYDDGKTTPTLAGIWRVDAADQTGETALTYVTDTAGDIDYELNISGTGTAVAVDSADITVAAASSFSSSRSGTGARYATDTGATSLNTGNLDISEAATANRVVYAAISVANNTAASMSSVTIGGETATLVDSEINTGDCGLFLYKATVTTGTTVAVLGTFASAPGRVGVNVFSATNVTTETTTTAQIDAGTATSIDVATVAGGHLWVLLQSENSSTWTDNGTGFSLIESYDLAQGSSTAGEWIGIGQATSVSTETRTVTTGTIGGSNPKIVAISLALS